MSKSTKITTDNNSDPAAGLTDYEKAEIVASTFTISIGSVRTRADGMFSEREIKAMAWAIEGTAWDGERG